MSQTVSGYAHTLMTVILHYGDPALTTVLARELETGGERVHVLDNGAPLAYDSADSAFWMRLPENIFWGGAFAFTLEEARRMGASYVWFCNNDIRCVSAPPYIPRIRARLARIHRKFGRSPGVYSPSVTRNPYHRQMVSRKNVAVSAVCYVDGIALVVSLECLEAVGGLDATDNPWGYGVDVWLSVRAARAGWPVLVDHELCLRHAYHGTAGKISGFMEQAAQAEDIYLTARMGTDWREQLRALQQEYRDEVSL